METSSRAFCDWQMLKTFKEKYYKMAIRPAVNIGAKKKKKIITQGSQKFYNTGAFGPKPKEF